MRLRIGFVCLVITGIVGLVAAQTRERPPGGSSSARYRVTSWPDHTGTDKSYSEEVEEHLNKMATEGWRFHSDLVGQTARMMVFEKEK